MSTKEAREIGFVATYSGSSPRVVGGFGLDEFGLKGGLSKLSNPSSLSLSLSLFFLSISLYIFI